MNGPEYLIPSKIVISIENRPHSNTVNSATQKPSFLNQIIVIR